MWSGSGAPPRLGCAGYVRHGPEEKCPCDPSAAPAGRVGPRVITYSSICGRAGRDDPDKGMRGGSRDYPGGAEALAAKIVGR